MLFIFDNAQRAARALYRPAASFKTTIAIIQLKKNKMTNSDRSKNSSQEQQNFQNTTTGSKNSNAKSNPNDSENLDQKLHSASKDINEKEIEKDLIENDPSEGYETHIDNSASSKVESDSFETIEPDQDNPIGKEFEIGQLGTKELLEDERAGDESEHVAPGHDKPSQRKF